MWVRDSTGGIQIRFRATGCFDYPVGQPLRVRCQGLVLGDYAGEASLGAARTIRPIRTGLSPGTTGPII
ncbi:MAG: DUF5689 domain-containing protein [Alistipes sp.]